MRKIFFMHVWQKMSFMQFWKNTTPYAGVGGFSAMTIHSIKLAHSEKQSACSSGSLIRGVVMSTGGFIAGVYWPMIVPLYILQKLF